MSNNDVIMTFCARSTVHNATQGCDAQVASAQQEVEPPRPGGQAVSRRGDSRGGQGPGLNFGSTLAASMAQKATSRDAGGGGEPPLFSGAGVKRDIIRCWNSMKCPRVRSPQSQRLGSRRVRASQAPRRDSWPAGANV